MWPRLRTSGIRDANLAPIEPMMETRTVQYVLYLINQGSIQSSEGELGTARVTD